MREQRAWLNGVALEDAHPKILLQHIDEAAPEMDVKTGDRAGGPGCFTTQKKITKRQVTIVFAVRERLDFTVRAEAASAVAAWAYGGGWLEISSRPGQRLWVEATQMIAAGRLREWTQDYSVILTAHHWPLWLDSIPQTAVAEASANGSLNLSVTGNHETRLEAEITPKTAALTTVSLSAGSETLSLTGINVTAGNTLKIWWDERHMMRIEAGGTGLLGKRTGDDLTLSPGRREIGYTLNTACDVRLMARGCWL